MEKKETTCTIRLEDQLRKRMKDLARAAYPFAQWGSARGTASLRQRAAARDVLDKSALYKPHTPNRLGSSHSGLRRAEALCCQDIWSWQEGIGSFLLLAAAHQTGLLEKLRVPFWYSCLCRQRHRHERNGWHDSYSVLSDKLLDAPIAKKAHSLLIYGKGRENKRD